MSVTLGAHRKPVPLASEDGKLRVWSCADCGAVYGSSTAEKSATECCAEMLHDCGQPVKKHYTSCDACMAKAQAAKEQKVFDKAEKIPWQDYDGDMVYSEMGDAYYPDVDTMVDSEDDPPEDPPRWAWACTLLRLKFNASDLVNDQLEADDHHEDSAASIDDSDIAELQKLLDAWCEKQTVETWFPDYSRVVICDDIVDERLADQYDEDEISEGK